MAPSSSTRSTSTTPSLSPSMPPSSSHPAPRYRGDDRFLPEFRPGGAERWGRSGNPGTKNVPVEPSSRPEPVYNSTGTGGNLAAGLVPDKPLDPGFFAF